ncbi:hypothetical protein C8F01DRAFT_1151431 [Mycena amicta]|nr:hypothetical protein C8F01DRAFT_1151431 [Mycena amicta]
MFFPETAKSGRDWTEYDLLALNITISLVDSTSFFGAPLPASPVDPIILNHCKRPPGPISKQNRLFFRYLMDANSFLCGPSAETLVGDFAAFLFRMLDYDEPERVVRQRPNIRFMMCGKYLDAEPDIVITDGDDFILLVQEDKRPLSPARDCAEAELIAEAVAAFSANNKQRIDSGLTPLTSKVVAGIVMVGTAPMFYKIPISSELVTAIATAQYPPNVTTVSKFIPPVPDIRSYISEGMDPLENRQVVFQCLEAFKQFLV